MTGLITCRPFKDWSELVQLLLLKEINQVYLIDRQDERNCYLYDNGEFCSACHDKRYNVFYRLNDGSTTDKITHDGWNLTKYIRKLAREFLKQLGKEYRSIIVGGLEAWWDVTTHQIKISESGWYIDEEELYVPLVELERSEEITRAIHVFRQNEQIVQQVKTISLSFDESGWEVYLDYGEEMGTYIADSIPAEGLIRSVWKELCPHVVERLPKVHVNRLSYRAIIPLDEEEIEYEFRPWHLWDQTYEMTLTQKEYDKLDHVILTEIPVIPKEGGKK